MSHNQTPSIQILGSGEVFPNESFDLKNYGVAPKTYLDRASALALAGASLALQDANLTGPLGDDFALVTITSKGCVETMRAFETMLHEKGTKGASPLLFSHSYFNSPAALLAIEWGIQGYHAPLVGEDFGVAADVALDILQLGYANKILVGAFEAQDTIEAYSSLTRAPGGAIFLILGLHRGVDDFTQARSKLQFVLP